MTVASAILAVVAMGGLGFLPVFEGPGYESALAAGLLLPPLAALATALDGLAAARRRPNPPPPRDSLARGVVLGAGLAALAWVTSLVHGLRGGVCDALEGSAVFALGPGMGAVMAGAWGAVAGEAVAATGGPHRARALAAALALAGPLGGIAVSLGRYYTSPMAFAFDPFFGVIAGPLEDPVTGITAGLLTYRAGSAMTLTAAGALALLLRRDATGRLAWRRPRPVALVILAAVASGGSVAHAVEGWRLGHWQTTATIAATLGGRTRGSRCDVLHGRALAPSALAAFLRECDAAVGAVERLLEVRGPDSITIFLFRDAAEKRRLTGAGQRLVTKPWRGEVYLQPRGYPDDWLGHELTHVVAAALGRGPLRVAGAWGGLVPDLGLIEGLAVAVWPPDEDLTPAEWSHAMLEAGRLPPLSRVFTLRFLDLPTVTSYTVAGAFVGWVRDRWGMTAVRRWYGGEPLPAIAGRPLAELERAWHADLRQLALPAAARAVAEARFDRPSVFRRRCRHLVDRRLRESEAAAGRGDCAGARRQLDAVRWLVPEGVPAVGLARCLVRTGAREEGAALLRGVAGDPSVRRAVRDRALMALGDVDARAGRWDEARRAWDDVADRVLDDDTQRVLGLRREAIADRGACARGAPACVAVLELLARGRGDPGAPSPAAALGAWAEQAPDDGLPDYLLGRSLGERGVWAEAARRLAGDRVRRDALRQRAIAACALDDAGAAAAAYRAWLPLSPPTGQREPLRRLVAGCGGGS
jgi:hypothetical protein